MQYQKLKILVLTVVILTFQFQLFSQTAQTDSLLNKIRANMGKHEAAEMETNALLLLQISEENNDNKNRLEALKFMGIAQHLQARYDSAIF